ncbi:MAG: DUF4175 family protein [Pirellulales bacterium]
MLEKRLTRTLSEIAERRWQFARWVNQSLVWLGVAALAAALAGLASRGLGPGWSAWPVLLVLGLGGWFVARRRARRFSENRAGIVRQIEAQHPELDGRLMAALTLVPKETAPAALGKQRGYLEDQLLEETLDRARNRPWDDLIPQSRVYIAHLAHAGSLVLLLISLVALSRYTSRSGQLMPGGFFGGAGDRVAVEPGDTEIEKGTGLLVMARFGDTLPSDVWLVFEQAGVKPRRVRLAKSLDDPVFGGRVEPVAADGRYHVEYGDQRTPDYTVKVFEYPDLLQADAQLDYPAYTGQPERTIEDTRNVTGLEGSDLTWRLTLNKPVAKAELVGSDGQRIEVPTPDPAQPAQARAGWKLSESGRYSLELTDAEGRRNKDPIDLVVSVLPNRPPELKLAFPRGDQRVSPLEEMPLEATVFDDYGLQGAGIEVSLDGEEPRAVTLAERSAAGIKQQIAHLLAMEGMQAQPDQLVSYAFWAEDVGPDGQPRRTYSDMFFAEVRPFDETFREADQPAGGEQQQQQGQQGQGQGGKTEELVKQQKEIVTATWNVVRRERSAKPSPAFETDVKTILDAENSLVEQAGKARGEMQNAELQQLLDQAVERMRDAATKIGLAQSEKSPAALSNALAAERAAYQALLKLRAREHQVTRGQRNQGGGGGGGGGNVSQQQLNELELRQDENRYETRREAQAEQDAASREQNQVQNRLRELARRQQDINQQLQELQTQLTEAKTEQEQEELRRRLQRLREEQQDMLRDVDELRSRMDQPQNQSRWSEQRQELENTREQVRRTSESLEQNLVPEALSSGTRAERELDTLREDFRRQSASEFEDEMQELRSEARQLDERQQQLNKQLESGEEADRKTLRDSEDRQGLSGQLGQQQQQSKELLDQMRRVTEQAETSEPLLSRQLYDTIRRADQSKLDSDLQSAATLLDRGFPDQAQPFNQRATQNIERLREGVERAAESVLGDEAEALQRARDQVDRLAERVQQEADQMRPEGAGEQSAQQREGSKGQAGRDQTGQRPGDPAQQNGERGQAGQQPGAEQNPGRGQQPGERSGQDGQDANQGGQREQGQQPQEGQQPGQGQQAGQQGEQQPSEGQQQGQGQQQGEGQHPGEGQGQGQQPGDGQQPGQGQQAGGGGQPGGQPNRQGSDQQQPNQRGAGGNRAGGLFDAVDRVGPNGGGPGPGNPITGEGFIPWSDQLRDVEDMLGDPELRAEAARIRDRARALRAELQRHSEVPKYELLKEQVLEPLVQLRDRIAEELARRDVKRSDVPLDRDPVPREFADQVREYYERLGRGE